ncbi:hypothetical protein N9N67_09955, partial [Bacteriovoracaceae bacterium]|nr:hypothetical protein [Bacteriovoracaceae bacterium]
MLTKKHPTFGKRLNKLFFISFTSCLLIFFDVMNLWWKSFLGINRGIGLAALVMFSYLIFGLCSGARVRCPQCN